MAKHKQKRPRLGAFADAWFFYAPGEGLGEAVDA